MDDAQNIGDGLGVGVLSTQWALDNGSFSNYSGGIRVSTEGSHWIRYFSTDKVGNIESIEASSVAIDATPPVSTLAIGSPMAVLGSGQVVVSTSTPLSVSAQDPVASGVASGVSQAWYASTESTTIPRPP